MKVKKSLVDERRNFIMSELNKSEIVYVDDMANEFLVSDLTIRRDLQYLEKKGVLERFYGGARLIKDSNSFFEGDGVEVHKHKIAKFAAGFIEDGDTLFINTSSTALLVLKYVKDKRVTVITNNGKAIFGEYDPKISIVLTGGELRGPKESMTGEFAISNLNKVMANKSFIGCSGISLEMGVTTAIIQEVAINKLMLKRCTGQTYILADDSKIGKNSSFTSGSMENINNVITNKMENVEVLNLFRDAGVRVYEV